MAIFRGMGQARWGRSGSGTNVAAEHEHARRPSRTGVLETLGTLACRRCDAPVAIGPHPMFLTDELACPFCHHRRPARDFLSLTSPTRPARVIVRAGLPSRGS